MAAKIPTLRDVAAEAGVAPMTASNALRGKDGVKASTRAKVLAAAKKLGYRRNLSASMLRSGRSNIIHIIVNEYDSLFYSKLIQAISIETASRGLTPFIEQTRYSREIAEQALQSNPLSGQLFDGEIIHAWGISPNTDFSALNPGRPVVLIDACEETPTVDAVNFPNEEGARAAVHHLIERGCRRIALVGYAYASRAELAHAQDAFKLRLRGACGALLDAGYDYDETTVFHGSATQTGTEAGHRIAEQILRARNAGGNDDGNDSHNDGVNDGKPPFDGVACGNDAAAIGVIRGLEDYGLHVPQDVKVIGFDGVTVGQYTAPSLSTIQVDLDQLARFALDMLTHRIEHPDEAAPPSRATIGYTLVARESTAEQPTDAV